MSDTDNNLLDFLIEEFKADSVEYRYLRTPDDIKGSYLETIKKGMMAARNISGDMSLGHL